MSVLSDLLTPPTQTQVFNAEVLPELQNRGLKTSDWLPGSIDLVASWVIALLRSLTRSAIATLAASQFGDYVFGVTPLPAGFTAQQQSDVLAWAPILAKQAYNIDQILATYTLRNITLTNSTATVFNKAAGSIIVQFPSGLRYVSNAAYVSAGNDTVVVPFRSEFVTNSLIGRSYTGESAVAIKFVTANLPGVTATNPAPLTSAVSQVGPGLGTFTASGTPSGAGSIIAKITASGVVGAGAWSTSIDAGTTYTPQGVIGALLVPTTGVTLTPADNGGSPSFLAGTQYFLTSPGSDITQVGRDIETPQALGLRCRAVFPQLAFARDTAGNPLPISPTQSAYQALVQTAFSQVTICLVATSTTLNNVVNVYIAGQGSALPASVIPQVQAFLNSLAMIGDKPVVSAPPQTPIALAGPTVTVKSALASSAKAAAQTRVANYLAGVDPAAPLAFGGLIDRSYLISLIRTTPGVTKMTDGDLAINGVAADFQLAANTQPTYAGNVASSLTWATV